MQDNAAREAMMAKLEQIEGGFGAGLKNPWKWEIRKRIWVLQLSVESTLLIFLALRPTHLWPAGFDGE